MILMGLPDMDISPLLAIAWEILQFAMRWTIFLSLLVFLGVLWAGVGDLIVAAFKKGPKGPGEKKSSRVTE